MAVALFVALFAVAPMDKAPQSIQQGTIGQAIGQSPADASHQPCRPTYWEKRRNSNGRVQNYRVVLIGETLRPGGRWINCQYQRRLHGFLISGTPSQGKFSRTVPHRWINTIHPYLWTSGKDAVKARGSCRDWWTAPVCKTGALALWVRIPPPSR